MSKASILFLIFSFCISAVFGQQPVEHRSLIKAARADARHFRLADTTWKKYRLHLDHSSDYFKPRAADVQYPSLINDSVYVEAYRKEAYKRNKRRHTPWHILAVGGGVIAGACALLALAIVIFVAPKMG